MTESDDMDNVKWLEMDNVKWLREAPQHEWNGSALNKCANEIERLREENARLEERNKKLNDDLLKQAELTAVTMTRCADLMPAQSAIVKLKDQQAEIDALKAEVAKLRKLLFDFEKFQEIYEKAMETK